MSNVVCTPSRTGRAIHRLAIALIAICGFATAASAQTTVSLSTPDTHINADFTIQGGSSGMVDFSSSDVLASKVSSASFTRRIMMKFDTQNFVPANAIIQSAKLYLVLKNAESSENRPLTVYNVGQSFVEGQTNWYYFRDGQTWSKAGGDFNGSFGTTYVGNAVGSTYTFDLTQVVQRSVNGDFGSRYTRVALVDTGGAISGNYRAFHSTRSTNVAARPRLVITYRTSTITPTPPPPIVTPTQNGTTLRVMQWNIHKTKGSDGACNPDRTANTIIAQNPQVVSLNEVNFFAGECAWSFDMSVRLQTLLQQKTGVTWYRQSVNPNGVGNVLFSRIAPVSSSSYLLDYGRGVAQMGIPINGRVVNVFSTHVEYDVASERPVQIGEVVRWMTNFSEPRIVMGDFNSWPNTRDYSIIANVYQDAWLAATSAGTGTSFNGTGATHGTSRFDYAFCSKVSSLSVKSVNVPDTRVNGVWASDHDPVVTVVTIK
jgi:endonuclease/exonuclease/phosphatase family metal-dependent hydrolase